VRERNPQEREAEIMEAFNALDIDSGRYAQELFESSFPVGKDGKAHTPLTDTRTPDAVASGLSPQEWRELNG